MLPHHYQIRPIIPTMPSLAFYSALERFANRVGANFVPMFQPAGFKQDDPADQTLRYEPSYVIRPEENAIRVEVALPGFARESVKIEATADVLTISGSRKTPEGDLTFAREFGLSDEFDHEGIKATFDNGLLTLRVPRAAATQPRRIELN